MDVGHNFQKLALVEMSLLRLESVMEEGKRIAGQAAVEYAEELRRYPDTQKNVGHVLRNPSKGPDLLELRMGHLKELPRLFEKKEGGLNVNERLQEMEYLTRALMGLNEDLKEWQARLRRTVRHRT